jgi:hypothetical protein
MVIRMASTCPLADQTSSWRSHSSLGRVISLRYSATRSFAKCSGVSCPIDHGHAQRPFFHAARRKSQGFKTLA